MTTRVAAKTPVNVVVGATSGIGREVAALLAARGPVLLTGRSIDTVGAIAAELGANAKAVTCDLSDAESIGELADQVGHLGALVVTAALPPQSPYPRAIIEVNLAGVARLVEAFAAAVVDRSTAVCFSTITAHQESPSPDMLRSLDKPLAASLFDDLTMARPGLDHDPGAAYRLAKIGIRRLCLRKAVEWAQRGGRFVCITPGVIETPMTALSRSRRPAFVAELERATALQRTGRPREVAAVVDFVCSPEASFLTGTEIVVDGGYLARKRVSAPG